MFTVLMFIDLNDSMHCVDQWMDLFSRSSFVL